MPIGTAKNIFGGSLVPGGTQTFNTSGTFNVPVGVSKVSITGKGATGSVGNTGSAGNPGSGSGNNGKGGGGGGGGAAFIYGRSYYGSVIINYCGSGFSD